jgi:hypothetical protein
VRFTDLHGGDSLWKEFPERMKVGESYLGCHIHVDTSVSSRIQSETGGSDCDKQWTCVYVRVSRIWTERVQVDERYLGCHVHVDTLVS